ncbi:MAG: NAD-dependent epimerase/dehydratase family protein [Verrucomicrobiaceae bacterium]|nr:MAG: NAD-dependent epimerase/dehydratase family protein [Verrucomicrobiaceae bacterium]
MTKAFITGAAGFIGSSMTDRLLRDGISVVGWDDFSTGQMEFLRDASIHPNFQLVRGDNLDLPSLTEAMAGCDVVFHFAANADVRFGLNHPRKDLEQNTIATFNVLEAMRANGINRIAFSSTGSVYGECEVIPTPEDAPFPVQTSLYAASKVAGETLIHSYCEGFGFEGYIFRFVSILGERYTHGHVFDFYRQLLDHPEKLRVLGDGSQRKSYLHVGDCVSAILHVIGKSKALQAKHRVETYNLGCAEYVQVNDSIRIICRTLGLEPELEYTGGNRGWVGDNPFIFLDTEKVQSTGWTPELNIEQGIIRTVEWLQANNWVYEKRA